jgi:hypothetical protein
VELDAMLLKDGLRPGLISTGRWSGHPYHQRDRTYRSRQDRYAIDV